MKKITAFVFLLCFLCFAASSAEAREIEGIVKDADGRFLADVKVQPSGHLSYTKTDSNGYFKIDQERFKYWLDGDEKKVVFFYKKGFLPQTIIVEPAQSNLTTTLAAMGDTKTYAIAACSAEEDKNFRQMGRIFQISVPKNIKIKRWANFEYETFYIKHKDKKIKSRLTAITGRYGDEFPPSSLILNSKSFEVRQTNVGLDWKGVTNDNKYWRYLATPVSSFETYSYQTESKTAADFFDLLLAGVCVGRP